MKITRLLYGAAYYDEYMPYNRIDTDMEMMKRAGMNVIRIAESTWSTIEPFDNVFDFTYLDRMLDASERHQISVIIGTPTYAIPPWMVKKHPDILAVTHNGSELYGHRQNMDITHPDFLMYAERVIRKIMEHIKDRTTIIGFQLDNETKAYDTSGKRVQEKFISYLQNKFPDIHEFNREFGLSYWSNSIHSWDDFPDIRGTINASLGAEFEKFQRMLVTDFLSWQASLINEYRRENQFITQNFDYEWRDYSFGLQPLVNQFEAAKCLTVAGADIYHPSQDHLTGAEIAFGGAVARGLKRDNYLILETQAQGNLTWLPYEGQLRLQAYSHISSGSNSVMYWHWHSIHNSFETYWKGVLSHDLQENPTYLETVRIGEEFASIGPDIMNLKKTCKVAFMLNNESLTGLTWFPIHKDLAYNDIVRWLYDTFYRINIESDIISIDYEALDNYQVIVIPALYSAPEKVLHRINDYVKNGGHIITTFKSGFSNEHLRVYHDRQPHIISECCGVTYSQFTAPERVKIKSHIGAQNAGMQETGVQDAGIQGTSYPVSYWMELLTATTAEIVASYDHPYWGKYAAVTYNRYGKGSAAYIGCYFDENYLEQVIRYVLEKADISVPEIRFPIICKQGVNDEGKTIRFYFNYANTPNTFLYKMESGTELLSGRRIESGETIELKAWDLVIIESDS